MQVQTSSATRESLRAGWRLGVTIIHSTEAPSNSAQEAQRLVQVAPDSQILGLMPPDVASESDPKQTRQHQIIVTCIIPGVPWSYSHQSSCQNAPPMLHVQANPLRPRPRERHCHDIPFPLLHTRRESNLLHFACCVFAVILVDRALCRSGGITMSVKDGPRARSRQNSGSCGKLFQQDGLPQVQSAEWHRHGARKWKQHADKTAQNLAVFRMSS